MSSRLVIFLVVFIDLLGFGIMIPMLPFYARSFGATATEVGALMFVYSFMQIFVAPLWGQLSDRYGKRPILLMTIFGQALAFLWGGFASSYVMLLLSRIFAGAFAANIATAQAYMADITPLEERAKGMGLIGAAIGLGFVFGPAIGGSIIIWGYEWPSFLASIIAFCNVGFAYFKLQEPQRHERRPSPRWELLKTKSFLYPVSVFFLLTFAFVQMEVAFGLFVLDRFHFTEQKAGYLMAFLGVMMALVQGGFIGKLTKHFHEKKLILLGIFFILLGFGGLIFSFQLSYLFLSLVALAIGYSLTNPCLSSLTSKSVSPQKQGTAFGLFQSGGSLARILGPLCAGILYDQKIDRPFFLSFGVVGIGLVLWMFKKLQEES